ncbi:hypothetical protein [Niallia sp. Krafla_26]|uniref:hypothetical protein n=1 Tax=Niallia sp. Krafla_26 TaxID=3064703 RepID=UPI003D167C07
MNVKIGQKQKSHPLNYNLICSVRTAMFTVWVYIEKHMEIGGVLEIITVPDQRYAYAYVRKILDNPKRIIINVGNLTYENDLGCFQLNKKDWIDDLKHRTLYTDRGITPS